jgi:hypothetical protein
MAASLPIQSRSIRTVESRRCGQHRGEVHGQRGRPDAALGSDEGVEAAELALARDGVAGRALQAGDGVAEIGALDGLQQKLVGARAHAGNHGFAVGVEVGGDHEQIGGGLLDLLDGLNGPFGIPGDIDDQAGAGTPLQVLQHPDVQVGGDLLVLRGHFGVGNVEQVVANHLTEMFVARSDHQCGVRQESPFLMAGSSPIRRSPRFPWARWW